MADEQGVNQEPVETEVPDEAIEREAREMGWNPDHKGANFIPAKEFVERGKSILPIVQASNARLKGELAAMNAAHASEIKALKAGQAALEEAHEADLAEARKAEREQVKAELAAASEAGDHRAVASATERLGELTAEEREAAAAATARKAASTDTGGERTLRVDPEVKAWLVANPTFAKDPEKVALGNVIGARMREAGTDLKGAAFLDEVALRVERRLGGTPRQDKLEGGGANGNGRTGGGGNGKGYNDLPPEAKAACDRLVSKLVGPGKAHKDEASWRKSYVTKYFQ